MTAKKNPEYVIYNWYNELIKLPRTVNVCLLTFQLVGGWMVVQTGREGGTVSTGH